MHIPNLEEARKRTKNKPKILLDVYKLTEEEKKIGINKKYFIKTYGCQMNDHDTENIKAILEDMSFTESTIEDADLILLNTCAIRENAHDKVFGFLGRLKHLKKNKDVLVGLCGCMAQEEIVINNILDKYKWLDFVFGTHNIYNLPSILKGGMKKQTIEVFSQEGDVIENLPVKRDSKYKAWVNIMYGCDKFCTYCIVPYVRGQQRSRLPEHIIKEVKDLIKEGYKEITLLGQNVNAYGQDIDYNMTNLLESVAKTKIERIRFVTSHPWDFSDAMIDVIAKYPNIMPHIHLPLQSGSNEILKQMGRRYTKQEYIDLYKKLKKALPHSSITTDIIVGFPNENDKDFQDTLDAVNECKFDSAFTFVFSPRDGTAASNMEDNVELKTKKKRLQELNKLINKYANLANQSYLNKTVPVLIEGESEKNSDILMGYTDTMKLVNVECGKENIGKIVNVVITDIKTWSMNGKIIS